MGARTPPHLKEIVSPCVEVSGNFQDAQIAVCIIAKDIPITNRRPYAAYAAHRDEEREARLSQAIRMREQKVNMQA